MGDVGWWKWVRRWRWVRLGLEVGEEIEVGEMGVEVGVQG